MHTHLDRRTDGEQTTPIIVLHRTRFVWRRQRQLNRVRLLLAVACRTEALRDSSGLSAAAAAAAVRRAAAGTCAGATAAFRSVCGWGCCGFSVNGAAIGATANRRCHRHSGKVMHIIVARTNDAAMPQRRRQLGWHAVLPAAVAAGSSGVAAAAIGICNCEGRFTR